MKNLSQMMKQVEEMQARMQDMQARLEQAIVTGQSGGVAQPEPMSTRVKARRRSIRSGARRG